MALRCGYASLLIHDRALPEFQAVATYTLPLEPASLCLFGQLTKVFAAVILDLLDGAVLVLAPYF